MRRDIISEWPVVARRTTEDILYSRPVRTRKLTSQKGTIFSMAMSGVRFEASCNQTDAHTHAHTCERPD